MLVERKTKIIQSSIQINEYPSLYVIFLFVTARTPILLKWIKFQLKLHTLEWVVKMKTLKIIWFRTHFVRNYNINKKSIIRVIVRKKFPHFVQPNKIHENISLLLSTISLRCRTCLFKFWISQQIFPLNWELAIEEKIFWLPCMARRNGKRATHVTFFLNCFLCHNYEQWKNYSTNLNLV